MTWFHGTQSMRVRRWTLLGLLLAMSILGHELLMATGVMTASPSAASAAPHGSSSHAAGETTFAQQTHGSTSEHLENCHVGQFAVPRNGDPFERADQELAAGNAVDAIAMAHARAGASSWQEPHWPPGTLRALQQVYRI